MLTQSMLVMVFALEKLNKHIETKIRIVSQFEESEGEK